MAMIACFIAGEIWFALTRIRFWRDRTPSGLPLSSSRTEFFACLNSVRFSSCGRSRETAIIIPNTNDTKASSPIPAKMNRSLSHLSFGLGLGGSPGSSPSPHPSGSQSWGGVGGGAPVRGSSTTFGGSTCVTGWIKPRSSLIGNRRPRRRRPWKLALGRMANAPSEPAAQAAWLARNAVDSLPAGALEDKIAGACEAGRPLRVKLGIDPTAPDIHLGHTVVLQKLREFQDAGHVVV